MKEQPEPEPEPESELPPDSGVVMSFMWVINRIYQHRHPEDSGAHIWDLQADDDPVSPME